MTDFRQIPLDQMRAVVDRFEQRRQNAMATATPVRDLVKRAIRRQTPARCPSRLYRLSYDVIVRHGDGLADLFCEFPDDVAFIAPYYIFVGYQPPERKDRIDTLKVLMENARWTDEWGTTWGHAFGGVGATPVDHPIKDWSQLDDYLKKQFPDPHAPGRLNAAKAAADKFRGNRYVMGTVQMALFERLHALRGFENTFEDVYTCESEVRRLLEALTEFALGLLDEWAKIGPDGILFTDDWGTQQSLMISPKMWRALFQPCYRRMFDRAHRAGLDVIFHSCGNVTEIVGGLIEAGVDALDPLQPGAMDLAAIAKEFGGRVAFHGGIDDQHLLTQGTPGQIRDSVRWLIDTMGRPYGNGLILSPANSIPPETPLENLRALFEACHQK